MARMGRTPRGHWLWTKKEDKLVRELYPDYDALQKALRRRTYFALRARARALNVVNRRHTRLGAEISLLRRMYPKAARHELMLAFPDVRGKQSRPWLTMSGHGVRAESQYQPDIR
jgi:hypothetical protein